MQDQPLRTIRGEPFGCHDIVLPPFPDKICEVRTFDMKTSTLSNNFSPHCFAAGLEPFRLNASLYVRPSSRSATLYIQTLGRETPTELRRRYLGWLLYDSPWAKNADKLDFIRELQKNPEIFLEGHLVLTVKFVGEQWKKPFWAFNTAFRMVSENVAFWPELFEAVVKRDGFTMNQFFAVASGVTPSPARGGFYSWAEKVGHWPVGRSMIIPFFGAEMITAGFETVKSGRYSGNNSWKRSGDGPPFFPNPHLTGHTGVLSVYNQFKSLLKEHDREELFLSWA